MRGVGVRSSSPGLPRRAGNRPRSGSRLPLSRQGDPGGGAAKIRLPSRRRPAGPGAGPRGRGLSPEAAPHRRRHQVPPQVSGLVSLCRPQEAKRYFLDQKKGGGGWLTALKKALCFENTELDISIKGFFPYC